MFIGTLPAKELSPILEETFKGYKKIAFPTSGNFTSERIIKGLWPDVELHSNDISFYSICLGNMISKNKVEFELNEEFEYLKEFMTDPFYRFTVVMFLMEIGQFQSPSGHAERIRKHLVENHKSYIERQVEKVKTFAENLEISSFSQIDLFEFIDQAEKGVPIACYPPTYEGGYEKLYKFIESAVEYDRPQYSMFNPDTGVTKIIDILEDRNVPYLVCSDIDPEDLGREPIHKIARNKKKAINFYGREDSTRRYFVPLMNIKECNLAIIQNGEVLSKKDKLEIKAIEGGAVKYYKTIYLSKKINSADAMFNYAVFVNEKLLGFIGYILSAQSGGGEKLYLACDFVVASINKGSKLVAMLAKSKETVEDVKNKMLMDYQTMNTTVFTDKPVSMKYRGVFKLAKKEPGKLMYETELNPLRKIKEIYSLWLNKYHLK